MDVSLSVGGLALDTLKAHWLHPQALYLGLDIWDGIERSEAMVKDALRHDKSLYGINTGFGRLAETRIPDKDLEQLQRNILLSHAAGTGSAIDEDTTRLIMVLKINSLAQGYSGISRTTLDTLIQMHNLGIYPIVPIKGSVGASGDLAPLAHLCLPLIGEGQVRYQGKTLESKQAFQEAGLLPITLQPKEGLALLNGTQVSTGLAISAYFQAENAFKTALLAGALTIEAGLGAKEPLDARIHQLRRQKGQQRVAEILSELLEGSAIQSKIAIQKTRVQDPYCLRCQPQVMGACLDMLKMMSEVLTREANAVTDNPLIIPEEERVLCGGNFHAEPVAMVADMCAIALSEIGSISERRTAFLMDTHLSKLPAFLVENSGIDSGFMIPQVTAAALVSENKSLAHPASVDSIPTSAGQEDHVSMATYAARRLLEMADNLNTILAIELLAACQGLEFRRPLHTSAPLEQVFSRVREHVPFYAKDRYFAPEIDTVKAMIVEEGFSDLVPEIG